jgi:hypothetical protein
MKRRTFILLICLFVTACSTSSPAPAQPVFATHDAARLASAIPGPFDSTPAPLQVSQTPNPTDELIVYPTPTNLVPTPDQQTKYKMANWTPQLANQLIETLRAYPDNLGFPERGYHDSGYYWASSYALFAEQEAQSRFPNSSFKDDWIWDAAYRMAQIGDPNVIESYAQRIDKALNTGRTDVQHLESWFTDHESRLQLRVLSLPPLTGSHDNYLTEISDLYQTSGIYLWLVSNGSRFLVYPLPASDHGGYGDFGFSSADGLQAEWQDVTGDGFAEIITTHAFFPGGGDALTTNFDIFDISRGSPRKIQFNPPIPGMRHRTWSAVLDNDQKPRMKFDFVFDRILCPFTIGEEYQWNGEAFELIKHIYPDKSQVIEQAGEECLDQLVFSLMLDLRHGNLEVAKMLDSLLDAWPYSNDPWLPGGDNSPNTRDKARFIIGLYLAFNGQVELSRSEMNSIISNPVIASSRWITAAQEFLAEFHSLNDLPDACIAVKVCGDFLDLEQIISTLNASDPQAVVDFINQTGVDILNSGSFDANNDGQLDLWIVINNHAGNPITWLFVKDNLRVQSFSPGNLSTASPIAFHSQQPFRDYPVFSMEFADSSETFIFDRDPLTAEIQVSRLCDHLGAELNHFQDDLVAGGQRTEIIEGLSEMGQRLDAACVYPYSRVEYMKPRWQYLLGLAYELAADSPHAVENFLAVWRSYPGSPYAIMSRARLVPISP